MEIGSSPAFCPLSTSLASDPSSQMSSPGWIRGDGPGRGRRTQCPDEASRGATCSQITTETIASSMAITTRTRNARLSARVSPSLVTSSTHDSASAAERIAFLTSARSAQRSTRPIGSEKEGANRIAFSHVLSSAHRLQVYLGHPRLNVPAIEHLRRSGSQGPPKRARQPSPVRSNNAARYLAVFGVDPSAQGGVHRNRVISPIRVI